jgi:hypothetical protein
MFIEPFLQQKKSRELQVCSRLLNFEMVEINPWADWSPAKYNKKSNRLGWIDQRTWLLGNLSGECCQPFLSFRFQALRIARFCGAE